MTGHMNSMKVPKVARLKPTYREQVSQGRRRAMSRPMIRCMSWMKTPKMTRPIPTSRERVNQDCCKAIYHLNR